MLNLMIIADLIFAFLHSGSPQVSMHLRRGFDKPKFHLET